ncbi:MAG: hypothetical protein P4L85_14300 [Paludisphaera borealis]|uniref:hypothetical protein n=1 Tax=Paludisphaera borealis TaxID=1387353 RepID=UPI0028424E10|nr:hypothetical protein [Paludisphaera borealis]MDR3620518.1 hypothetical protein [Paludisphaera borealis]
MTYIAPGHAESSAKLIASCGAEGWRKNRSGYLQTARNCREALTDPNGPWGFGRDDERVKEAVGKWVARARKAHKLARAFAAREAA